MQDEKIVTKNIRVHCLLFVYHDEQCPVWYMPCSKTGCKVVKM